ncbi:thermonuclease family protein [Eubacteriales bacterium KG127]
MARNNSRIGKGNSLSVRLNSGSKRTKGGTKSFTTFLIMVSLVLVLSYAGKQGWIPKGIIPDFMSGQENASKIEGAALCERVVDGDTIVVKVDGVKEKVRLIGVDTPESVHPNQSKNTKLGKEVSNFTKKKLEGKYVRLETDVQERDKYGRILAYVYIDNKMFNKTLLEKGYAKLMTVPPNVKHADEFEKIVKEK